MPPRPARSESWARAYDFWDRWLPKAAGDGRTINSPGTRLLFAFGCVGFGMYATYIGQSTRKAMQLPRERGGKLTEEDRMQTFSAISGTYDDTIGREEFWMGLALVRRWMMTSHAKGDVLEVGAGTGRNISYYTKASSVTYTDQSQAMLDTLSAKLPDGGAVKHATQQAVTTDLPFPKHSFDTVVSTFGLCSYEDPVKALVEMQRVCKPDGKLLLLEHGVGTWPWINQRLDAGCEMHAKDYGCVWNKPIASLIDQAGLDVEYMKRWHFGTTYYCIAHPSKRNVQLRQRGTRGVFSSS
eukprot:TRINITY_DN32244_c0_g1_i1.p1 TRINITY_DN32244_c0_g1~~TRINITY_DN32244_c0_g1_i1.p1  ORF type:complete len:297 (+),score=87.47 TRINITY_DN32244_c0_g1_i1:50-940(+)